MPNLFKLITLWGAAKTNETLIRVAEDVGLNLEDEMKKLVHTASERSLIALALTVRDHPNGGVEKVMEVVEAIASIMDASPPEGIDIRGEIEALTLEPA